jgi:hypothetical protein
MFTLLSSWKCPIKMLLCYHWPASSQDVWTRLPVHVLYTPRACCVILKSDAMSGYEWNWSCRLSLRVVQVPVIRPCPRIQNTHRIIINILLSSHPTVVWYFRKVLNKEPCMDFSKLDNELISRQLRGYQVLMRTRWILNVLLLEWLV